MSAPLQLAQKLIARPSLTPDDAGCQEILAEKLKALGFEILYLHANAVKNLWARYGTESPLFVFAGHTDVVPPGDLNSWQSPPFEPKCREGFLYGRGAADMKGAIAAMVCACENFLNSGKKFQGSIAFLITSDEEGLAIDGTRHVVQWLKQNDVHIDFCLVGEASSEEKFGDVIKIGRRGSLNGELTIFGQQGHIAYPHLAQNPLHLALPALLELTKTDWDQGRINPYFSPTCLQISNFNGGLGVTNVIPGECKIQFNLRYSPEVNARQIEARIHSILTEHKLSYKLDFSHSGPPFYSPPQRLASALKDIIYNKTQVSAEYSTSGGTSDGRFLAEISSEILEFGVVNKTIHKTNECVKIADLEMLSEIYQNLLERI